MRFRVAGRRRRAEGPFRGAGEAAVRPVPPPARYGRGGDRSGELGAWSRGRRPAGLWGAERGCGPAARRCARGGRARSGAPGPRRPARRRWLERQSSCRGAGDAASWGGLRGSGAGSLRPRSAGVAVTVCGVWPVRGAAQGRGLST